ncbi:MAG TPA: hypothetical protein VGX03_21670 [Candidatus Binatia bacterium]|jgi:hypothetical protein|nr:hypothetical protein [Candidatus Binatia bacterium]
MTSTEYEEVTKNIVDSIFHQVENIPSQKVRSGLKNEWEGISQAKHQIDVSVEGYNDVLLVECKKWKEQVDFPSFLSFLARIIDIKSKEKRNIHGIFVTTVGFDQGNIQKAAEYYGIHLQLVQSASEFVMKYKTLLAAALHDNLSYWADEAKPELK